MANKKRFKAPTKNKEAYWIPVVVKNKDYLLGFLISHKINMLIDECHPFNIFRTLSSDRFNDILPNGERIKNLTDEQLKGRLIDIIIRNSIHETHPENDYKIYYDNLLNITCFCGMPYNFKDEKDLPEESIKCPECKRFIIYYTGCSDDKFFYTGDRERLEKVMAEIQN